MRWLDRFRDRELYRTKGVPKRAGMHYADSAGTVYLITRVIPKPRHKPVEHAVRGVPVGRMKP